MSPSKVLESLFGHESGEADDAIMPRSPLRRVRPTLELSTAPVEEILPQPPTLELSTAPAEEEATVNVDDMVKAANVLYHEKNFNLIKKT
jgi:hypothetical protein